MVISVLLKNAKERNGRVQIERERVEVTADDYSLVLRLNREVDVTRSSYKMLGSKIEICLAKVEGVRWEALEQQETEPPKAFASGSAAVAAGPPAHPSSKKNWDKMAKEIEEKEAGEMQVSGCDGGRVVYCPDGNKTRMFPGRTSVAGAVPEDLRRQCG